MLNWELFTARSGHMDAQVLVILRHASTTSSGHPLRQKAGRGSFCYVRMDDVIVYLRYA